VKYAWIDAHRDRFSVARMCRQLGVSRTGYCQWRTRPPSPRTQGNAALDARVAVLHAQYKRRYGRPRIVRALGQPVGHERVRKSLQRQGLRPLYRRPYRVTTDSDHRRPVAPNVLDRRFGGWQINQAWVGDITYIATAEGWLYLACIMDLASRRIVGWSMSDRITSDLVCQALKSAYGQRKPPPGLIMHTDRGSQYAGDRHRTLIRDLRLVQSMSRKGNCWDNAVAESFFQLLKRERIRRKVYLTRDEAREDVFDYVEMFYNRKRKHGHTNMLPPAEFERQYFMRQGAV
jgi:transposase InsO family protein